MSIKTIHRFNLSLFFMLLITNIVSTKMFATTRIITISSESPAPYNIREIQNQNFGEFAPTAAIVNAATLSLKPSESATIDKSIRQAVTGNHKSNFPLLHPKEIENISEKALLGTSQKMSSYYKYVIHTTGPVVNDKKDLTRAITVALDVAKTNLPGEGKKLTHLAIPMISSTIMGGEKASFEIIHEAVQHWLLNNEESHDLQEIRLVCFSINPIKTTSKPQPISRKAQDSDDDDCEEEETESNSLQQHPQASSASTPASTYKPKKSRLSTPIKIVTATSMQPIPYDECNIEKQDFGVFASTAAIVNATTPDLNGGGLINQSIKLAITENTAGEYMQFLPNGTESKLLIPQTIATFEDREVMTNATQWFQKTALLGSAGLAKDKYRYVIHTVGPNSGSSNKPFLDRAIYFALNTATQPLPDQPNKKLTHIAIPMICASAFTGGVEELKPLIVNSVHSWLKENCGKHNLQEIRLVLFDGHMCGICLDTATEMGSLTTVPCPAKHIFHEGCVTGQTKCPTCKQTIAQSSHQEERNCLFPDYHGDIPTESIDGVNWCHRCYWRYAAPPF